MAQKVTVKMLREDICMKTLRWLKIRIYKFLLIFSLKYPSRVKTLRWLTFLARKLWDGSKYGPLSPRIQFLFEFWAVSEISSLKKGAISKFWHVMNISSWKLWEAVQFEFWVYVDPRLYVNRNKCGLWTQGKSWKSSILWLWSNTFFAEARSYKSKCLGEAIEQPATRDF